MTGPPGVFGSQSCHSELSNSSVTVQIFLSTLVPTCESLTRCDSLYLPVCLQSGDSSLPLCLSHSNGSKKSNWFLVLSAFYLLRWSSNVQTPYMEDQKLEVPPQFPCRPVLWHDSLNRFCAFRVLHYLSLGMLPAHSSLLDSQQFTLQSLSSSPTC